jgi:uncharacterized protein YndB with AHSA1/START domain
MRVQREVVLDATVDEAWSLLTEPDELAAWLGTPVALDLHPGGTAAYLEPDGTSRFAMIEEVVEGQRLSFVWWDSDGAVPSRVEFELTQVAEGVRVGVTETRASVAGASLRIPLGVMWDDRMFDLERRCLTRQFSMV